LRAQYLLHSAHRSHITGDTHHHQHPPAAVPTVWRRMRSAFALARRISFSNSSLLMRNDSASTVLRYDTAERMFVSQYPCTHDRTPLYSRGANVSCTSSDAPAPT
jgi:hypothetical protein